MTDHTSPAPGGLATLAGRTVPRIGYGAMQLPRLGDPAAGRAVLRRAYELGVRHVDTAEFYGHGASNRMIAVELGGESDVLVVTKVGARPSSGSLPLEQTAWLRPRGRYERRSSSETWEEAVERLSAAGV